MANSYINSNKTEVELNSAYDYFLLLKPRVMSLAIFTALVGQLLGYHNVKQHPLLFIISLFSIALGAGAAGCINMWYERDIDAVMLRTKNRPIPTGKVEPDDALCLGIILSIISVVLLSLASNYLAGFLLSLSILFYIFVYTIWLKRKTVYNIVIGGAAGALPPLIGWVSITNEISIYPIILFLIIFIWTPPHFWALSLYVNGDYKKANIPMLPVVVGREKTIRSIIKYSYYLYFISLTPYIFNVAGKIYLLFAILLSSIFTFLCYSLKEYDLRKAKNLFKYSIFYLFILYLIMIFDKLLYI